ncbi:MAG: heme o synthase [Acidimicrobiia bacterium]
MLKTGSSSFLARCAGYVALTKPRIIELLLVSTVPTMVVAKGGMPSIWLIVATVIGGTLSAGGANAINMYVDRDIDAIMTRTQNRPLVTGIITPRNAIIFAVTIEVIAFFWLWYFVNLLSAVLAVAACLFYVFVYTLWLKRTSKRNVEIGGAAGAVPVLIGWTSITNGLEWAPVVLFLVVFFWTPPHTWALATKYKEDYSSVHVPMLPAVASMEYTAVMSIVYSLAMWAASLLFWPLADMGLLYGVAAIVLGAIFTWYSWILYREKTPKAAMRLFGWSITYLTLLFVVMAVDQFIDIRL